MCNVINGIIFSKDRACQLHLLLRSIGEQAANIFDELTVIYTASTSDFMEGYNSLISYMKGQYFNTGIKWVLQSDLTRDTLAALSAYSQGTKSFTTFFTDDSVFYRNIIGSKEMIQHCLNPGSDICCFSLRTGKNTTEQTYYQPGTHLKLICTQIGNIIKWRHVDYHGGHGYGYPMSVDGHVFRSAELWEKVVKIGEFANVNALEGALTRFKFEVGPCMASFEKSALVIVPINRVQDACPNVAGAYYGISAKQLNDAFLNGECIDYHAIDFSKVNGTHNELEYKLCRR